jgi:hypothetical protein
MSVGRRKIRNSSFSGNMNRGATDLKDGKVAIVRGGKRKVFGKTNHCYEKPAMCNPHAVRKDS